MTVVKVLNAIGRKSAAPSEYLSKIGEWIVESTLENVGMAVNASGTFKLWKKNTSLTIIKGEPLFYHLSSSKQLFFSRIHILDRVQLTIPEPIPEDTSLNNIIPAIPIPNPFKSRRPRISHPTSVYDVRKDEEGLVKLDAPSVFSDLNFGVEGDFQIWLPTIAEDELLIAWNEDAVKVCYCLEKVTPNTYV